MLYVKVKLENLGLMVVTRQILFRDKQKACA